VLEDLEANELLALLANLGAQQQAVLAAIAGKHQGSQRAADRRQPESTAFPSGLSSLPISRPVLNLSAAAGEAAAAAQQQKPEQKPWRVPGGRFALPKCNPCYLVLCALLTLPHPMTTSAPHLPPLIFLSSSQSQLTSAFACQLLCELC